MLVFDLLRQFQLLPESILHLIILVLKRISLYDVHLYRDAKVSLNVFIATFNPVTGEYDMALKVPEIKDFYGFQRRIHITISTWHKTTGLMSLVKGNKSTQFTL